MSPKVLYLTLFYFVTLGRAIHQTLTIGLLIDYEEPISRGIDNQTVESLAKYLSESLLAINITVNLVQIEDFDQFSSDVEEDPRMCERMTALISATSCPRSRQMYDLIAENCPTTLILAVHERNCQRPAKFAGLGLPVMASVADTVPMLVDMRHDFLRDWDKMNIVHDSSIATATLHDLVDGLASATGPGLVHASVTTFQVDSNRKRITPAVDGKVKDHRNCMTLEAGQREKFSAKHLMRHLEEESTLAHFIVIGTPRTIETIVEEAHNRSLLSLPRRWLLVFSEVITQPRKYWSNLSPILAISDTAVVQREVNEYSGCGEMREGCQLRLAFELLHESIRHVAESSYPDDKRDALVIRPTNKLSNDYDFNGQEGDTMTKKKTKNRLLSEIRTQLGAEMSAATYCGACDKYVLKVFERKEKKVVGAWKARDKPKKAKSVWVDDTFDVRITQSGEWTPFNGLEVTKAAFQSDDDGLLAGKPFVIGVIQQLPRIHVAQMEGGRCNVTGVTEKLLSLMAERGNFTIQWNCDATEFGRLVDGKWTGLMGLLVDGKISMAANFVWKLPARKNAVKWSIPWAAESVGMMVKKTTEDNRYLFLLPFTYDVWYCILLATILIGPLLYYINKSCRFYDYYGLRTNKGLFKFRNCVWYTYGAVVGQGGEGLPTAIGARCMVAFWWLFVIVTATTYSGNLVALLTFPKIVQPIQNVQDLMNAWFMSWGTQKDSDIAELMLHDKWSDLAKLHSKMEYLDIAGKRDWIYNKAGDGHYAWIGGQEELKFFVSKDYLANKECKLHIAREMLYRTEVFFAFNKNTPDAVVKQFNAAIIELGMTGIISHWIQHYAQLGNDCLQPLIVYAGDVRQIEMLHMHGSYMILISGLVLSVLVFFLELAYLRFSQGKHSKEKEEGGSQSFYSKAQNANVTNPDFFKNRQRSPTARQPLIGNRNSPPSSLFTGNIQGYAQGANDGVILGGRKNTSGLEGHDTGGLPPQYSAVYKNSANNTYNTTSNYNYYDYAANENGEVDGEKTDYKAKFGL